MNILFLLRLWPVYGGGETVTICLANEFVKRGHNVHVLYFKKNSRKELPFIDKRIQSELVENIDCDEFHASEKDAGIANNYLKSYIEKNNITHVIDQWWPASYIKGVKDTCGVKVYKCLHQVFFSPKLEAVDLKGKIKRLISFMYLPYKRWRVVKDSTNFLPYVDKYIFLSPSFQHQFEAFAKYQNDGKLTSIPNPLVFDRKITAEEFEAKENIALIVARMEEVQKRISAALQAWQLIEKRDSLNAWKLVIVGEGRDLNNYKDLAKKLNLRRVSFEGFQDPINYYIKSKIFIMTSYFEGFPMTLVESQQSGLVPVVMDSFLSLHDIIKNNTNGIITTNGDIVEYANALGSLMTDDENRRKYAANGLKSCEKFSIKSVCDRWESLFNEI